MGRDTMILVWAGAATPKTYATPNMTSWKYFKELKK